jgi:hypothetical protein
MVEEGAEGAWEAGLPADWAVGIARGGGVWRGKGRGAFETVCLFIGLRSGRKGACLPKATSGLLLHAVLWAARGARWRTAGAAAYPTAKTTPGKPSYLGLYHASPLERISLIKEGVPASDVKLLLADLHIAQGVGFRALNLATATVNKKARPTRCCRPRKARV